MFFRKVLIYATLALTVVAINPRCGPGMARCPEGLCCSYSRVCGNTPQHCGAGCLREFGACYTDGSTQRTPNPPRQAPFGGRCGAGIGSCANGACCSRSGICGTSAASCESGCQPQFGLCSPGPTVKLPPAFDYRSNSPFLDHNRQCTAPRLRKEFRELTQQQRREYIQAMQCLRQVPSGFPPDIGSRSAYDDLVYVHMGVGAIAHNVALFLPWHRLYLLNVEDLIRKVCRYRGTMPYWDWTLDAEAPQNSPIWADDFMGGDGLPGTDCISSGPFYGLTGVHPSHHCVKRRFDLAHGMYSSFYTPEVVSKIVRTSQTYLEFRHEIETKPHGSIHSGVGGNFATATISTNDPLFFLHHTNMDRLWWIWQSQSQRNMNSYGGNRNQLSDYNYATLSDTIPMLGLSGNKQVWEVMSTVRGGRFCYQYTNMEMSTRNSLSKRDLTSNSTISFKPNSPLDMIKQDPFLKNNAKVLV
ncbi:hypothetical protein O5D80_008474 [Batrachochytrium dendrobatidis]|nr:hypothetical protein O5D80_008474 [Batrachochytrium dendrobatidis]